jgi:hypothetical protein
MYLLLKCKMKENFELEMQDPKRDEEEVSQEQTEAALNELKKSIESADNVIVLSEAIYDSGDQELVKICNRARYEFLQETLPKQMAEYEGYDAEGFLLKSDERAEHLTAIDTRTVDGDFINLVQPLLLQQI